MGESSGGGGPQGYMADNNDTVFRRALEVGDGVGVLHFLPRFPSS